MNFFVARFGASDDRLALFPTPGFRPWAQATDIGTRGALAVGGRAWVVMGARFYEVNADQTLTPRGAVAQDSYPATISYNGPTGGQLFITSGGNGYLFIIATNVFSQVLTGTATMGAMIDTFFLAFDVTLAKVRISNSNDGSVWDPTQFAVRTAQPDPWIAMVLNHPDIWFLGELTSDVWYNSGAAPFPLAPRSGLTVPYGLAAPFSVSVSGGSLTYLARNKDGDGVVVKTQGYSARKISTSAVDTAIAGYKRTSTIADAESMSLQQEGHTFYVLRFPTARATWVFDETTGIWAERGQWIPAANSYDVWAPRVHFAAFGKHLVGDASTGVLSAMDITYGSEADGTAIRRLRRGPVLVNENKRIRIQRFDVFFQAGVGTATGQGSNPKMMYRGSRDGGQTWGNEREMGMGAQGDFPRRAFVTRVGSPRLWVPEITVSDPVPPYVLDAFINNNPVAA